MCCETDTALHCMVEELSYSKQTARFNFVPLAVSVLALEWSCSARERGVCLETTCMEKNHLS